MNRAIFLLLLPEFLWFDVMTSRETLLSVLIIVSIFSFTKYPLSDLQFGLI